MDRFIPVNAETREFSAAAVIAYCYDSKTGPAFIAYKGRKSKATRHYAFSTPQRRDESLAMYVQEETRTENQKRAQREVGHGLAVGEIVYSSWGYEQTNVDFYQVVRVPSALSAVVRKVAKNTIESTGGMSGKVIARPGEFVADALETLHRAAGLHYLNGGKNVRGILYKWDGTPRSVTCYA